jgi:hypothetical protein
VIAESSDELDEKDQPLTILEDVCAIHLQGQEF